MPYCVRCGVKLEDSSSACPLCSTPVPEEFITHSDELPTARDLSVTREVKLPSRYVAGISTLILLIPLGITLIIDVSVNGVVTWSYYAMISIVLFWILLVQPFILRKSRALRSITNDFLAIAIFLILIDIKNPPASWAGYPAASLVLIALVILLFQYVSRGYLRIWISALIMQGYIMTLEVLVYGEFMFSWSLQVALPIIVCIAVGGSMTLFFFHRVFGNSSWSSTMLVISLILFFTGCLAGIIELILLFGITGIPLSGWSLFIIIPCFVLSALSFYAARTRKIHSTLKKRFHV